jgi:hypothetical protein
MMGYADNKEDRKSTTGWCTMLGGNVINWASKKQATVALSSCEAELNAETSCLQEILCARHLLGELGLRVREQSVVYGDNEGTIKLSVNGHISERTKHVQVHYYFGKDAIDADLIKIVCVGPDGAAACRHADQGTAAASVRGPSRRAHGVAANGGTLTGGR